MKLQITYTTDGRFLGHIFDGTIPIVIGDIVIPIESREKIGENTYCYSNSNYIIYAKEV